MNSKELMKKENISAHTLRNWRRGYYYRSEKDENGQLRSSIVPFLPNGEKLPGDWVLRRNEAGRARWIWEYDENEVQNWIDRMWKYREQRNGSLT